MILDGESEIGKVWIKERMKQRIEREKNPNNGFLTLNLMFVLYTVLLIAKGFSFP